MSKQKNALQIPDSLFASLASAEQRYGLPAGTMLSVMQQEIGGQSKYLQDPAAYHYGLNAEGKRVAPHTGKVSTAFGPFGILESTAADPGYGVKPLKSKALEDQVDFAASYLAARSKGKGIEAGLAGYGEGEKYAQQVMARAGQPVQKAAPVKPVMVAHTPLPIPTASQEEVPKASNAPVTQDAQWAALAEARKAAEARYAQTTQADPEPLPYDQDWAMFKSKVPVAQLQDYGQAAPVLRDLVPLTGFKGLA